VNNKTKRLGFQPLDYFHNNILTTFCQAAYFAAPVHSACTVKSFIQDLEILDRKTSTTIAGNWAQ
jgi:hypothetical protein